MGSGASVEENDERRVTFAEAAELVGGRLDANKWPSGAKSITIEELLEELRSGPKTAAKADSGSDAEDRYTSSSGYASDGFDDDDEFEDSGSLQTSETDVRKPRRSEPDLEGGSDKPTFSPELLSVLRCDECAGDERALAAWFDWKGSYEAEDQGDGSEAPLLKAAFNGDLDQVREVLENNPELLNATDSYGRSALTKAAEGGRFACVEFLLAAGAKAKPWQGTDTYGGKTPLLFKPLDTHNKPWFDRHSSLAMLAALVAAGLDIHAPCHRGFHTSSMWSSHRQPSREERKAGRYATETTIFESARLARDDCLDFLVASEEQRRLLLAAGARYDADVNQKLCDALDGQKMRYLDVEAVRTLLQKPGADVNYFRGSYGSLLMVACSGFSNNKNMQGEVELVRLLLDAGADPNVQTCTGRTALSSCFLEQRKTLDIARAKVELLLSAGAENILAVAQATGETPLHKKARAGNSALLDMMIQFGAEPDIPANEGVTATYYFNTHSGSRQIEQPPVAMRPSLTDEDLDGLGDDEIMKTAWYTWLNPPTSPEMVRKAGGRDPIVSHPDGRLDRVFPTPEEVELRRKAFWERLLRPRLLECVEGFEGRAERKLALRKLLASSKGHGVLHQGVNVRESYYAEFQSIVRAGLETLSTELIAAQELLAQDAGGRKLIERPPNMYYHGYDAFTLHQLDVRCLGRTASFTWLRDADDVLMVRELCGLGVLEADSAGMGMKRLVSGGGKHDALDRSYCAEFCSRPRFYQSVLGLVIAHVSKEMNTEWQARMAAIAERIGPTCAHHGAGVKKLARVLVKSAEYAAENEAEAVKRGLPGLAEKGTRLCFSPGCSFVVDDARTALLLITTLMSMRLDPDGLLVVREKNGHSPHANSEAGYRDWKAIIIARDRRGFALATEVQIILKEFYAVKNRMHLLYVASRGDFG